MFYNLSQQAVEWAKTTQEMNLQKPTATNDFENIKEPNIDNKVSDEPEM